MIGKQLKLLREIKNKTQQDVCFCRWFYALMVLSFYFVVR